MLRMRSSKFETIGWRARVHILVQAVMPSAINFFRFSFSFSLVVNYAKAKYDTFACVFFLFISLKRTFNTRTQWPSRRSPLIDRFSRCGIRAKHSKSNGVSRSLVNAMLVIIIYVFTLRRRDARVLLNASVYLFLFLHLSISFVSLYFQLLCDQIVHSVRINGTSLRN